MSLLNWQQIVLFHILLVYSFIHLSIHPYFMYKHNFHSLIYSSLLNVQTQLSFSHLFIPNSCTNTTFIHSSIHPYFMYKHNFHSLIHSSLLHLQTQLSFTHPFILTLYTSPSFIHSSIQSYTIYKPIFHPLIHSSVHYSIHPSSPLVHPYTLYLSSILNIIKSTNHIINQSIYQLINQSIFELNNQLNRSSISQSINQLAS